MPRDRVVIIGGGIIGQAHALTALEAGWAVTLLERDSRPLGASVRNFGTLLPLGCTFGAQREQALFGVRRWKELAAEGKFWLAQNGAVMLAYREEAWSVLQELASIAPGQVEFQVLQPREISNRFPTTNPDGLRGGLYSTAEALIHPPSAMAALTRLIQERGAEVYLGTPIVKLLDDAVETSDGRIIEFDQLVIAAGDEMRMFFPVELAAAQLSRCRLQMMRTVPQPENFSLGGIFLSDLSFCHYAPFRQCRSQAELCARLEAELPEHCRWGVHVIVVQHPDGSLVIGDSHEYGADFEPESYDDVEELIRAVAKQFVRIPNSRIAARWQGVYLKSRTSQTQVILHPRDNVTMVTAIGGLGMTLSWAIAKETITHWSATAG